MSWLEPARIHESAEDRDLRESLGQLLGFSARSFFDVEPTSKMIALAEDLRREALRRRVGAQAADLTVLAQKPSRLNPTLAARREPVAPRGSHLSFSLHAADADVLGQGQWLIVMSQD